MRELERKITSSRKSLSLVITNIESRNHGLGANPVGDLEGYINKLGIDERAFDTKVQDMRSSMTEKM